MGDFPPDELAARRRQSGRNDAYRWTTAMDSRLSPAHALEFERAVMCRCILSPLTRWERLALWWDDAKGVVIPMAVGLALGFGVAIAVYVVR